MPQHRLNDRTVKTAELGRHPDGGGLYLQVTAGKEVGQFNRSWLFRYATGEAKVSKTNKQNGIEKTYKAGQWMGLGSYPDVSLAEAREQAAEKRKLRRQGIDPIVARDAERASQAATAAKAMTFDQCCDGYVADHEKGWSADHRRVWINSIRDHVTPVFGKAMPVAMVDTPLVLKVLKPIWQAQHPTASRLRPRIEAVLDWAVASHYRESGPNPARWRGHLDQVLARTDDIHIVEHHPSLPYAEIGKLVVELEARDHRDQLCLLLIIFTAVRLGAAVGARAEEFDLEKRIWTIPPSRMKRKGKRKSLPFRVPLSDAAVAVVKRVGVTEGLLFPGADDTSLARLLERLEHADITTHGFRSTFRDWAAECTSFPREVIEMSLAHVVGNETEEAYFRSDLLDRRRKLMADWATYCTTPPVKASNKIVPLHKSA